MSCDGYLVQLPTGGEICIPIYREEQIFHKPGPPEKRAFDDITVLVAIHQRIAQISDHHIRESLTQAVVSAAKTVQLPKGVTLGDKLFGGGPAMATSKKVEVQV